MSMYDRDWYREEYRKKEKEYGGDFSLHSKKVNPEKENQKQSGKSKDYSRSINQQNTYNLQKYIRKQSKISDRVTSILIIIICPIFAGITGVAAYFIRDAKFDSLYIPGFTLLLGVVLYFDAQRRNTPRKNRLNSCAGIISLVTAIIAAFSIIIIIIKMLH